MKLRMNARAGIIAGLAVIACLQFAALCALAAPAAPDVRTLVQPDGRTFSARQWGDEWNHGWETPAGYSIVRDENSRQWVYAVADSTGELRPSAAVVGQSPLPAGLAPNLRPAAALMQQQRAQGLESLESNAVPQSIALNGSANILTILVKFRDRTTSYARTDFTNLLFGYGTNSMRDYYTEVSHGLFTVSAGPGGVAGWYTAASGHDYYGANVGGTRGNDAWPGDLVYEAIEAADNAGFNFTPYDQDWDCRVDVVNIIHQGTGEETGVAATDIWSHSWDLDSARAYGRSHHGAYKTHSACANRSGGYVTVSRYVIEPEIYNRELTTVGVFAHEYGHALGLPDLYDTGYDSYGIGDWSLMAGGSWNAVRRRGDRPAHLDAWCKVKLGWLTPIQISSATPATVTLNPAYAAASGYQFGNGSPASGAGEYFLIENRQRSGFDAGLPGAGLLVWHIDEAVGNNDSQCVPVGSWCSTTHYKVALIQADNLWSLERNKIRGDAGDPFPGTSSRTAIDGTTTPAALLYSGAASGVTIGDIAVASNNITAVVSFGTPVTLPTAPSNLRTTAVSSNQASLAWNDNSTNEDGFYLERKTGSTGTWSRIASLNANLTSYSDSGLTAGTTYYYRVQAYNTSGNSAYSNEVSAATPASSLPGAPSNLTAAAASASQINLTWRDNSINETGFRIERKTGASGTYAEIATPAANAISFSNTGLTADTTYYYRVRAYITRRNSGYSNEVSAVTPASSPPGVPANLTAAVASVSQINLTWRDDSTNETGFRIERKTGASGTYAEIATTVANMISYSNTGLTAGTTYYYRVRAYNTSGKSAYSKEVSATTPASACTTTAISVGSSASGALATTDCRSTVRANSFYDNFTFTATAGTTYAITLNSTAFDAFLSLLNGATVLAYDDNGNGGINSKIVYTATASGTLTIHATSNFSGMTGAYTVSLAAASCTATPIGTGSTSGTLATTDCRSTVRAGSFSDNFTFAATAGRTYTITLSSRAFDTYLFLLNSPGTVLASNDDYSEHDSRIVYTATTSGTLTIHATSYVAGATGAYTVTRN